jgi:hypothetical protein
MRRKWSAKIAGGNEPTANDRGTEPGAFGSPDYSPAKLIEHPERVIDPSAQAGITAATATEASRLDPFSLAYDAFELDDGAGADIDAIFRRMLMALRHMPRKDRPGALRAAREWRRFALKELRDKRTYVRRSRAIRRLLQRQRAP